MFLYRDRVFYLVRFRADSVVDFSCEPASVWCARSLVGFCAKRATRRGRTRKRNDDDKKPEKKKKKKKKADQKENTVMGGYFMVLITAGSIQRVLNRLFCV